MMMIDAGDQQLSVGGPSLQPPNNWPSDVPIYPGAHISQTSVNDGGTELELMFESNASASQIEAFYRAALAPMRTMLDLGLMGARTMLLSDATKNVSVLITAFPNETRVTLGVTPP
jgi:hypothetical protein